MNITEAEKLAHILMRCRTVLGNMALENEGALVWRWPISHEPLRADAKNLVPLIDEALSAYHESVMAGSEAAAEIKRLRAFVDWVDSWVSNPVTSYSVYALDGLFGLTRHKLAALTPAQPSPIATAGSKTHGESHD